MEFGGKVALVTGAGSGIGRETAAAFARAGASVLVSDVNVAGGEATVATIEAAGGRARFARADVSDSAQAAAMVAAALDAFGRLDVAVNNAGVDLELTPEAEWDEGVCARILAINLTGVFVCMRHEVGAMLPRGGGAIVNVASMAGLIGVANKPAYTASKHGVVGLTRASALQYGRQGIRVNAVCPAAVDTPILDANLASPEYRAAVDAAHPIGRMGQPADIAAAILWLASPAAGFVTGHALAIDGGLSVQ